MNCTYPREDKYCRRIISGEKANFASYRKTGNCISNEIMEILRSDSRLSVSRCVIAGSIGKRTSLGLHHLPDFDIVVFLNNLDVQGGNRFSSESFEPSLDIIKTKLLERPAEFTVHRVSDIAVTCEHLKHRIYLDIVPAVNFYKGKGTTFGRSPGSVQLESVLNLLGDMEPAQRKYLSSSVAEATVKFVKHQPPFVHDMVVLAKWWSKSMAGDTGIYVSGRSSIFELVAIQTAQQEINYTEAFRADPSHYRAFKRLLQTFAQPWQNVRIVLGHNHRVIVEDDVTSAGGNTVLIFYKDQDRTGIILDPVNPYHNFLNGLGVKYAWSKFQKVAEEGVTYLQSHEARVSYAKQHLTDLGNVIRKRGEVTSPQRVYYPYPPTETKSEFSTILKIETKMELVFKIILDILSCIFLFPLRVVMLIVEIPIRIVIVIAEIVIGIVIVIIKIPFGIVIGIAEIVIGILIVIAEIVIGIVIVIAKVMILIVFISILLSVVDTS